MSRRPIVQLVDLPALGGGRGPSSAAIEAMLVAVEPMRDAFAGWLLAGGTFWLGFTQDASSHLNAVVEHLRTLGLLEQAGPVGAFLADFTEAELRAVIAAIDLGAARAAGVNIGSIGLQTQINRIMVGIPEHDTTPAERYLWERWPEEYFVVRGGLRSYLA